jgi:hypothetical protein
LKFNCQLYKTNIWKQSQLTQQQKKYIGGSVFFE